MNDKKYFILILVSIIIIIFSILIIKKFPMLQRPLLIFVTAMGAFASSTGLLIENHKKESGRILMVFLPLLSLYIWDLSLCFLIFQYKNDRLFIIISFISFTLAFLALIINTIRNVDAE